MIIEKSKSVNENAQTNISNSVNRIMKSLQTIQNTRIVLRENECFINEIQYKQIA